MPENLQAQEKAGSEPVEMVEAPMVTIPMEPDTLSARWMEFIEKRDDLRSVKIVTAHKETGSMVTSIDPYIALDFMLTFDAEESDRCLVTAYPLAEDGRQLTKLSPSDEAILLPVLRDFKRYAETGFYKTPKWPQPEKGKSRI